MAYYVTIPRHIPSLTLTSTKIGAPLAAEALLLFIALALWQGVLNSQHRTVCFDCIARIEGVIVRNIFLLLVALKCRRNCVTPVRLTKV